MPVTELSATLDHLALLCYSGSSVSQSPAVWDPRETSKDRNGDAKAACGFFMILR